MEQLQLMLWNAWDLKVWILHLAVHYLLTYIFTFHVALNVYLNLVLLMNIHMFMSFSLHPYSQITIIKGIKYHKDQFV